MGSNTTGACAVYQSGLVEFSKTRTEEIITQFLESYGNSRFLSQYSFLKMLILDQVISIVAFHLSIIKPLARYYAGWTVVNLAKETKDTQDYLSLSSTEETRLTRALYRFQLYCNLFGVSCHRSRRQWMLEFESVDILRISMGNYELWDQRRLRRLPAFTLLQRQHSTKFLMTSAGMSTKII